ncbi:MAG: hypothetical protein M0Z77_03355 [Thermoplasmatales archaeon]|nr:hypothetical protein [Thermoplasmatales archaeon]
MLQHPIRVLNAGRETHAATRGIALKINFAYPWPDKGLYLAKKTEMLDFFLDE